ncbi:MAG: hypothetical protein UE068_13420 [Paludibacteraceae bacterium]|nr:hypothetical protein [Paludibacteraceae bacterium]
MNIQITSKEQLEDLFKDYKFNDDYPAGDCCVGSLPKSFSTRYILTFPPYNTTLLKDTGLSYFCFEKEEESGNFYLSCDNQGGHVPIVTFLAIRKIEELYDIEWLTSMYRNWGEGFRDHEYWNPGYKFEKRNI